MTDQTEAPELLPCPFCKGGETRIEPCGLTWRGQGYSDPQFYRLTHHGKLPQGDGFETCHILFRARTIHDIVSMWNTRADLSDTKDKRIEELEAERDELAERVNELQHACEVVSSEFEGELWQSCRRLLQKTGFDFHGADVDGIQADNFESHMNETLAELKGTD